MTKRTICFLKQWTVIGLPLLSELCSSESIITYYQIPTGTREEQRTNQARDFPNVKDVTIFKINQKLKEHMGGAFSGVLYQHDVTTKQWGRTTYNYNKDKNVRYVAERRDKK